MATRGTSPARPDPGWELYRSFLAVVREGSLSAAARRLALTQPTIGRHVAALEEGLAVPLFTRSPAGLEPTAAARDLLPHAEAMAAAAEALIRAASGEAAEERGTVRLTASEIIGAEVLPAMLERFAAAHPAIVIELALTNRTEDLLRHEADLAVRMARPHQAALVARRIGAMGIGLYAHRRYVRAYGLPRSVAELSHHRLIGFDRDDSAWASVGVAALATARQRFVFKSDSDLAQLAALRAGMGIGGLQRGIARRERDLVAVLPDAFAFELPIWLVLHEDLRASRRVGLLLDHLARELGDYVRSAGASRIAPG
jgi:DNA-binding transcriptional LysR family regulator